jgi:hypothetical protein
MCSAEDSANGPGKPDGEQDERARKAREAYEQGLIERGEAAVADADGKLPPGATHEIVGKDATGRPILKRRRFSAA